MWNGFAIFFLIFVSSAEEAYFHYGELPEKTLLLNIQTQPRKRSTEILGTLSPASLSINGQSIALKNTAREKPGAGVWLNNKKMAIEGTLGRFFSDYVPQDQNEKVLRIYIQDGKQAFEYELSVDSFFLDFPLNVKIEKTNFTDTPDGYEWTIRGPLAGKKLTVNKADLKIEGDEAHISKKTPVGDGVLTGRVINEKGVKRLINIPYSVSVRKARAGEIVFSTTESLDGTFVLPKGGRRLEGVANPEAVIHIGKQETVADENGHWNLWIKPIGVGWDASALVAWNKKSFAKKIHFKCDTCTEDDFVDHWELNFLYGASEYHGRRLQIIGPGFRHRSGIRMGLRNVEMKGSHDNIFYSGTDFYFGYQFLKEPFPGRVWLEGGSFLRHHELPGHPPPNNNNNGPSNWNNNEAVTHVGVYLRSEPLRFWKVFGAGAQWDIMKQDQGRFSIFITGNYSF